MRSTYGNDTDLLVPLVKQLESVAHQQQRSVSDIVRERLLKDWPALPDDGEMELALFTGLSDDVLWLLARSTFPVSEQEEVVSLNRIAQQRLLTKSEEMATTSSTGHL